MQDTLFEPTALPELPSIGDPSSIERLLFESSILSAGVLAIAAIFIAFILFRAAKAKLATIALLAGLVIAAGIFVIGSIVSTPREQLKIHAVEIVDAVSDGDEARLRALLDPKVRVRTRFGGASTSDQLVSLVTTRANNAIEVVHADEVRVGLAGPRVAQTQILVRGEAQGRLPKSWWVIDWTRQSTDSENWVATHIEPIWIQGMTNPAGP